MIKAQTKWRWEHAIYFWLGGMGAAAYVVGVLADFSGADWATIAKTGVFLGGPLVAIGAVILLFDLGTPLNAIHAWKRPGTSWIARGVIILSIFILIGLIHIAFWIWPFHTLDQATGSRQFLGILGIIFAFGVMLYTGFLLGANRPVAFWANPILPLIFLTNALYTGVLVVVLVASFSASALPAAPAKSLDTTLALLIIIQLFILGFYLQGSHRTTESRASAQIVLAGKLAGTFWFGVIVIGLLLPLVLVLVSLFAFQSSGVSALHVIAGLTGLIGSLLLRQTVLAGGVLAPMRVGRFEAHLPHI